MKSIIRRMSLLEGAPRFDGAQAVSLARTHYGLDAAAQPLASERDQNFLLVAPHGRFVLKIANRSEPRGMLEAQNAVMGHLARSLTLCPTVVAASNGDGIIRESSGHFVRLLTWLPGTPLGAVSRHSDRLLRDIGRRVGELDLALCDFDHPALHREFHWDLRQAFPSIRAALPDLQDAAWRSVLDRELDRLDERLAGRLERLRQSIIHNDANDYNVLVCDDPDTSRRFQQVSGLIDFGDMVYGWTVADLAVALAYAILDKPDPVEAAAHVVRGYHAANPLGEEESVLLFDLVKLRLCLSVALAARQSRQRPGDDYLTISQAAIRRTLPRLIAMDARFLESAMLTRIAARRGPSPVPETETPQAPAIRPHVGRSLRLAYRRPVHIARASMQYVYDSDGRRLLDAYNNVPHVGHCHPDVVRAAEQQLRLLNTNTRYVHDSLEAFARELAATMPDPLSVCYFVNSGSEANELAIRLARVHTGRRDVLVLEHAYHGITTTLTDISPYKFDGPGGDGRQAWVHVAPIPDVYRGRYRDDLATAGKRYADDARLIVEHLMQDRALAAFIAESAPSVAGQIILPPGYLERTYASVRAAGAVCIADEVQTAYGRMGTHFYAFQAHDVVPDIVVLGKPIGNGHPLGAVVTTPEIAASFDNGLELFSTFGGSTVSCAVGRAVLDVVRRERVEEHARRTGGRLLEALRDLQGPHPVVGDVRGSGLYLGVELVTDREARRPATAEADYVVNRLREEGILIGTDGPQHNVLKIRPPMPFSDDDAGLLVGTLDRILREMREQGGRRQP